MNGTLTHLDAAGKQGGKPIDKIAILTEDGAYGHVVALVAEFAGSSGVILDLGCGFGAIAEPVRKIESVQSAITQKIYATIRLVTRGGAGLASRLLDLAEQNARHLK